jgi:hypothetical protein
MDGMLIFSWIVLSIVIGIVGSNRKIGFGGAFFISLILSPLIGLIFTLTSKNLEEEKYKEELLRALKRNHNGLNGISDNEYIIRDNELKELNRLRESASITEYEYQYRKSELDNR